MDKVGGYKEQGENENHDNWEGQKNITNPAKHLFTEIISDYSEERFFMKYIKFVTQYFLFMDCHFSCMTWKQKTFCSLIISKLDTRWNVFFHLSLILDTSFYKYSKDLQDKSCCHEPQFQ